MPPRKGSRRRGDSGFDADLAMAFTISDGTLGFASPRCLTAAEARRQWPAYRKWAWLRAFRLRAPGGAACYDGLALEALPTVYRCSDWLWDVALLPEAQREVAQALADDRAAVRRHQRTAGGRAVADVLEVVLRDLEQLEAWLPTLWSLVGDPGFKFRSHAYGWRPAPSGWRYGEALAVLSEDAE